MIYYKMHGTLYLETLTFPVISVMLNPLILAGRRKNIAGQKLHDDSYNIGSCNIQVPSDTSENSFCKAMKRLLVFVCFKSKHQLYWERGVLEGQNRRRL